MSGSIRPAPRYLQIARHYRDQIANGMLRPGDRLPSERRIAAEWQVARPTAARALQMLSSQGVTESRQGLGSYVIDRGPLEPSHRPGGPTGPIRNPTL